MEHNTTILLQLLLAHVLTDFVFQTAKMVEHKRMYKAKSWYLYVHTVLAGVFTYLILQQWTHFLVPIAIIITHYLIDLWKIYQKKDNLVYFLIDQFLHLIVLVLAWLFLTDAFTEVIPSLKTFFSSPKKLVVLIGYIAVIFPVGFIIGKATERWQQEITQEEQGNSLKKAGRYIGVFERILVLTFILSSNFSAIGFLIGAKSILRFSDSKGGRKQTEYVLIGTLMSFAICTAIGLLVLYIIKM